MTRSEKEGTTKADVESVLAEFDDREDMLAAFCAKTKNLIEASLQDAKIRYQSVQARVKTKRKLKEKYLDETKNYQRLDDITDLAGLRIVTYYDNDIDPVADVIRREFDIDPKNSVDKRDTDPDRFGYRGLNYVCRHLDKRTSDVEYKRFAGVCCEIQIASILSHAWSEIEHEWYDLKEAYPNHIKRKFSQLAALLELAESEFLSIRASRTQYERSVAVQVEAKMPDIAVDAVSMKTFIEQEPLVSEINISIADIAGIRISGGLSDQLVEIASKAARLAGMTKLQDIRDSLKQYGVAIPEFVRRCLAEVWPSQPQRRPYSKSVSVYQLAVILVSRRGKDALVEFYKVFEMNVTWDTARQAAIAQEILRKYFG
jgi:putative GTP pyrophosphokinase